MLAGATGLVGGQLLDRLGADPDVGRVVLPVRRALARPLPAKAEPVVVDFARLDDHPDLLAVDQLFLCLGTTIRRAGSQAAFRAVDLELVGELARRALDLGAEDCLLISSIGADPRSRVFYSSVKGQAEDRVSALPWRTLSILRPSLITGDRAERRPAERAVQLLAALFDPILRGPLGRWRAIPAGMVAEAMARLARHPRPGTTIYESERIRAIAEA